MLASYYLHVNNYTMSIGINLLVASVFNNAKNKYLPAHRESSRRNNAQSQSTFVLRFGDCKVYNVNE